MDEIAVKIPKQRLDSHFVRFLIAGGINTVVGFGIIFLLMFLNVTPQLSNICGYVVGLTVSFTINRNWVFPLNSASIQRQVIYFLLIFMVAFGVNFIVLNILLTVSINAWLAQIFAGVCYTLVFYVLNKRVVFT